MYLQATFFLSISLGVAANPFEYISKKFAKIGLSTPKGVGLYLRFLLRTTNFFCHTGLRAKPRQKITTPKGLGFLS